MGKKIGVIEGNWYDDDGSEDNVTVRPLFDFLSDLHYQDHHSYLYHMAETKGAFRHVMKRIAKSKKTKVVVLAMHGNKRNLHLDEGQKIDREFLADCLVEATKEKGAHLTGLYIGACKFGTREMAEYLFSRRISVKWIAGYRKSVDFVDSTGLDLLFFNCFLDESEKIRKTANRMKSRMRGLCDELGFSIYVRKSGSVSGVQDLLRS